MIKGRSISLLSTLCGGTLITFIGLIIALIVADISYLIHTDLSVYDLWQLFTSPEVLRGLVLSLETSFVTLILVALTAIPCGYALSRYRLPGHTLVNTIVDFPIVLPPVVIGVSFLAFFGFGVGASIKSALAGMGISLISGFGIVLCQYLISVSYCIRASQIAFDEVDREYENVACTMGCSQWQAFWKVSLPLARRGIVAGCIIAWARAVGVFGPLMVFVGTSTRVQVMPTALWLELSVGNVEVALAIALIMLFMAASALMIVNLLAPGRKLT